MNKQTQNSTQFLIGLLMLGVIATMALFFSSCKKKKEPPPVPVVTETFYMVTFDSNGGTSLNAIKIKKGYTLTLLPRPTKTDFVFGGWYTDKETSVSPFSTTTTITADITLYAKWDVPEYTVSFDSKGGSAVAAIQVKKGNTITLPPDPTNLFYTFDGWYTDNNTFKNQFDTKTPINANLTLYAKWKPFTLSSTSFSNGGAIPPKHAYPTNPSQTDRFNISPQLSWLTVSYFPHKVGSYLIIMEDTTTPGFNHWTVYNIPASKTSLEENDPWLPAGPVDETPGRYRGPSPDPGAGKHTYKITIFALVSPITRFNSANFPKSEAEADRVLGGNILGRTFITGTFETK